MYGRITAYLWKGAIYFFSLMEIHNVSFLMVNDFVTLNL